MAALFGWRARDDLREAWKYIAEESFAAADRVLDTINKEAQLLATQPRMGRLRPELGRGIRSWPTSTSYILFYVVKGREVIIVRALHHARDIRHIAWTK